MIKEKLLFLKNRKWILLRFWVSDINKNPIKCISKIKKIIRKRINEKEII